MQRFLQSKKVHNAQRLLMGAWLEILDVTHAILVCGDDRFTLCADDYESSLAAYGSRSPDIRER